MVGIDIRRGMVRLADFNYAILWAEKREAVRIRFKKPTNIIIHCGTTRISGVIHDISVGGCRIMTLTRQGLGDCGTIQVELKLIDRGTGLPNCRRIPISIVQICGETAPFKCLFRFHHDKHSEQFLSPLVNQRQFGILKELRETL